MRSAIDVRPIKSGADHAFLGTFPAGIDLLTKQRFHRLLKMLSFLNAMRARRGLAVLALLCGTALTTGGALSLTPEAQDATFQSVRLDTAGALVEPAETKVLKAAEQFVGGMVAADADTVWMFASEEDQDAFGTEADVYDAFAETFPVLTQVEHVSFERGWDEGDTPFVELSVTDRSGGQYRATMGFWLDDAGDWKLISCDIKPTTDHSV